ASSLGLLNQPAVDQLVTSWWEARTQHENVSPRQEVATRAYTKTCFVATSPDANITVVESLLRERQIEALTSYSLAVSGTSPLEYTKKAISTSDLVIGILKTQSGNLNILFEIGVAHALGKPILVLVQPGIRDLPLLLRDLLYLRTELDNKEAIGFALDQLLKRPASTEPNQQPSGSESSPIGPVADLLLERFRMLAGRGTEQELSDIVAEAIRAGGISIVEQATGIGDKRLDLAVWSNELEPWLGGPLVIEVKSHLLNDRHIDLVRNQVLNYIEEINTSTALVIYGDVQTGRFDPVSGSRPSVLFIPLDALLSSLRTQSFAEAVLDWRDRVLAGEPFDDTDLTS
ncbi:MAG: hypothetical protein M3437_09875, partial [Chloroflexota bacterium]|nr:hypothetical protein [Chloroflexota bacterium]